jgi:hypothetical protein
LPCSRLLEVASGRHKDFHATADDTKLEAFMFIALVAISQPLIFKVTGMLRGWLVPEQKVRVGRRCRGGR